MRNHHQQRLWQSLASLQCFVIFKALLLYTQVATAADGDGPPSFCSSGLGALSCPAFNNTSLFPFVTSQACGATSSLVLTGCDAVNKSKPTWPGFLSATQTGNAALGPPVVMDFFNPFYSSLLKRLPNESSPYLNASGDPLGGKVGLINLTWFSNSSDLLNQNACKSPASLPQITQYLPTAINLTSFAHSSFQLTPSNIILLFNCSSPASSRFPLQKESTACNSFVKDCTLQKKEISTSNCYQYALTGKELKLQGAMESANCETAMFFVKPEDSSHASQWSPGLIQLSWSTNGTSWMASSLTSCEGCLHTNGTCGYDASDNFQCYCSSSQVSATNCAAPHSIFGKSSGCKNGLWCSTRHMILLALVIGIALVNIFFLLLALFLYWKIKMVPLKSRRRSVRNNLCRSNGFAISHLDLDGLMERPIEYQYASIALATKHFSNLLGEGGFGTVYKGNFGDANTDVHMQIAVKVLEVRSKHSKKQFLNEVAAIGRIHHVHVVRLLGFCIEENHEMLVYEYVSHGSLDKWLFHHSDGQKRVLLWDQRYAIAVGVAKGLSYLHEECRHRIVHCDIKPQNILLDKQLCPKIADFGLARLMGREESRVATLARGTPGYMAPEFWMGGESQLSTKFDVYSYGMVVLELISGQCNFGHDICFPKTAFEAAMQGDYRSIMDVKLGICKATDDKLQMPDDMQWQQVRTTLLVALWCIQDHPMNRPSMGEVVQYLEGRAVIDERPPRPTIASTISASAQQHPYAGDDLYDDITPISGGR